MLQEEKKTSKIYVIDYANALNIGFKKSDAKSNCADKMRIEHWYNVTECNKI